MSLTAGTVCNLSSLGLGGNEIHDDGAVHLADALKANSKLKSLGLGGNLIGQFENRVVIAIMLSEFAPPTTNSGRGWSRNSRDVEAKWNSEEVTTLK